MTEIQKQETLNISSSINNFMDTQLSLFRYLAKSDTSSMTAVYPLAGKAKLSLTKQCLICKKIFSGPLWYMKDRIYCSNKCVGVRNLGENNPAKRIDVRLKISKEISKWSKKIWQTKEYRERQIKAHLGKSYRNSGQFKKGFKSWNKGKTYLEDNRIAHKDRCPFWKGGKTQEERKVVLYRIWRNKVFERDNYICQKCNQRGGRLNAHHIKKWSKYLELRFDINNGLTLCRDCHKLTDNWGTKHG